MGKNEEMRRAKEWLGVGKDGMGEAGQKGGKLARHKGKEIENSYRFC